MIKSRLREELLHVNGLNLQIYSGGVGEAIIVLHGISGNDGNCAYLEFLAEEYQVIAPSHPGFGKSELPLDYNCIDDLVYLYFDLFEQLNLDKIHLVGISLGGWIAAEIAIRSCERLASLTLIDALGIKASDSTTADIKDIMVLPIDESLRLLYCDPKLAVEQIKPTAELDDELLIDVITSYQSITQLAWKPFLHNPKLKSWLRRITVPTQVLWGEGDRIVSASYGKAFADAIPNAQFEIIPGAGHIPHLEQSDVLVNKLKAFFEKI